MKRIQRLVRIHLRPTAPEPNAAPLVASIVALLACLTIAAGAPTTWLSAAKETTEEHPSSAAVAPLRQVAVTFVNFPATHLYDDGRLTTKTRKLMRSLAANKIQAVGFVNEARLYKEDGVANEARVLLLREWLDAGHELGNETFRHTNLFNVSLDEFKADVLRGEQIMSGLVRERGKRLRYFSYPYLNTGSNLEKKRAAEAFLRERGYRIHPVTIDNMDWLFSKAYIEALRRNDEAMMARIRAEYVPYMERMFEFVEGYSRDVVGREFPQVLMLTAGALNADTFDDLTLMMKRRGYSFVTMEQATKDEAYNLPDTYTGARGDSWVARWAVTKGMEYKDSEENLPPMMQEYFDNFLAEQRAKNAGKK